MLKRGAASFLHLLPVSIIHRTCTPIKQTHTSRRLKRNHDDSVNTSTLSVCRRLTNPLLFNQRNGWKWIFHAPSLFPLLPVNYTNVCQSFVLITRVHVCVQVSELVLQLDAWLRLIMPKQAPYFAVVQQIFFKFSHGCRVLTHIPARSHFLCCFQSLYYCLYLGIYICIICVFCTGMSALVSPSVCVCVLPLLSSPRGWMNKTRPREQEDKKKRLQHWNIDSPYQYTHMHRCATCALSVSIYKQLSMFQRQTVRSVCAQRETERERQIWKEHG